MEQSIWWERMLQKKQVSFKMGPKSPEPNPTTSVSSVHTGAGGQHGGSRRATRRAPAPCPPLQASAPCR